MSRVATGQMPARLAVAQAIVEEAAQLALQAQADRAALGLRAKQPQDFVSAADEAVERMVRQRLAHAFPGEPVFGEEYGQGHDSPDAARLPRTSWVVDPIDGTANFLRGVPLWAVSLGFVRDGQPHAGVVAMPALGLVVAAERGAGLFVNGRPAVRDTVFDAVRIVSLGDARNDIAPSVAALVALRQAGWVVQAYRSTATAMAFAAIGRLDGHVQHSVKAWDMAGGLALCAEAGLVVCHGDLSQPESFVAVGTSDVLQILRPVWPEKWGCAPGAPDTP